MDSQNSELPNDDADPRRIYFEDRFNAIIGATFSRTGEVYNGAHVWYANVNDGTKLCWEPADGAWKMLIMNLACNSDTGTYRKGFVSKALIDGDVSLLWPSSSPTNYGKFKCTISV